MDHTYIDAEETAIVDYIQSHNLTSDNSIFQYRRCAEIYIADGNPAELMISNIIIVTNTNKLHIFVYKNGCFSKILNRVIAGPRDIYDWILWISNNRATRAHHRKSMRKLAETHTSELINIDEWTENIPDSSFKLYVGTASHIKLA